MEKTCQCMKTGYVNGPVCITGIKEEKDMLINTQVNEGKNVLIIDDEDINFFALAEVLKSRGYRCFSANNSVEAFSVLKTNNNISAIVMDIMMPGVDGIELTATIKKEEKYRHIPIIVTTAFTTNDYKERALNAGAEHYIKKPVNIDELTEILAQVPEKTAG